MEKKSVQYKRLPQDNHIFKITPCDSTWQLFLIFIVDVYRYVLTDGLSPGLTTSNVYTVLKKGIYCCWKPQSNATVVYLMKF